MIFLPPVRRARFSFGLCVRLAAAFIAAQLASSARAQDTGGDESIADPELGADEVIADPEMGAASSSTSEVRAEPNGEVHLELHSRLGIDTAWEDAREDVLEATQIALLEARVRRSERVRFAVGIRARYEFVTREGNTPDALANRYELDAVPTAGYVDVTAADGLHLRLGYQSVRLGRFDVINPTDILSAYDLRSGPATLGGASEIAQPALRIDWDIGSWFGLRAIVLPFFEPFLVHATDGDYALAPLHQSDIDMQYAGTLDESRQAQNLVRRTLSRSGQAYADDASLSAFTPEPSFARPQAALRLSAHAPIGEVAMTGGVAREHWPAPSYDPAFLDYVAAQADRGPSQAQIDALWRSRPVTVHFDPYAIVSLDAATALGPVQLGFEVAYMWHRTLLAARTIAPVTSADVLDTVDHSNVAHGGVRVEYAPDDDFIFTLEASAERALQLPTDLNRRYLFLTEGRWTFSGAGFVTVTPGDIGLTLEFGSSVMNGPTYLLAPRAEQRITDGLYVEVGAYFIGGAHHPFGDPALTLGAIYDGADQVFVGIRWVP